MPPRGQPPTTTHVHDPPLRGAQRHPHLLPLPNAECVGGGAAGPARRRGARAHPRKVMPFRGWGRGRPPHFGGTAHAEGGERGGGRGAFLGDREPQRPARLPPPDRPSEQRSWPPSPCPAARGTPGGGPGPRSRSSLPAATGVRAGGPQPQVPRRAGEGGRPPTPTRPGSPLPRPPPQPPPVPFAAVREPPPPSRPGPRSPR